MLALKILIMFLVSADLVCLTIFLQNLGVDLFEDDILFLKKQVYNIGLVDFVAI